MTTITSLPNELLLNIFNKFDKLAHLAECRLVCKAWTDLAKRTIFGHTIAITTTEAKMCSLYAFLQNDPAKMHLIRHLHFDTDVSSCSIDISIQLVLQLVLTPNIESITGQISSPIVYNLLMYVIEGSCTDKLGRLNTLAFYYNSNDCRKFPLRLALHCSDTIQKISVAYPSVFELNFADIVSRFQHLTSLRLKHFFGSNKDLNKILDNCIHLQELTLTEIAHWYIIENIDSEQQAAKKYPNVKALNICSSHSDYLFSMIKYFLIKLFYIEKISINVTVYPPAPGRKNELLRIPKLVQGVPRKELIYRTRRQATAHVVSSYLKEVGYSTTVKAWSDKWGFCIPVVL